MRADNETPTGDGAWKPQGVPFFWAPKEAMRKIEQNLELDEAAGAKLVYIALEGIASDERRGTFVKPLNYIATLASVSRSTLTRRLRDLERFGLVRRERFALKQPNRYTLLRLAKSDGSHRPNDGSRAKEKTARSVTHL